MTEEEPLLLVSNAVLSLDAFFPTLGAAGLPDLVLEISIESSIDGM